MSSIPRDRAPDSSLAFLRDGYEFVAGRCRRYGTDAFETRLLGDRVVCMQGEEAARVFYVEERFTRKRGLPRTGLELLLDFGSVGVLDGEAHRRRKATFMSFMTREGVADLAQRTARAPRAARICATGAMTRCGASCRRSGASTPSSR